MLLGKGRKAYTHHSGSGIREVSQPLTFLLEVLAKDVGLPERELSMVHAIEGAEPTTGAIPR